jgi:hypothetical protein
MIRLFALFLALFLVAGRALAMPTDETRVRSASSIYTAPSDGRVTATGFLEHRIRIRDRNQRIVLSGNVRQFRDNQGLFVFEVVRHSDGQYSIRFDLWLLGHYYPNLRGGSVEIVDANGARIDIDGLV